MLTNFGPETVIELDLLARGCLVESLRLCQIFLGQRCEPISRELIKRLTREPMCPVLLLAENAQRLT
jgi:hypothetical protein